MPKLRLYDLRQTRLPQAVGMALRDVFPQLMVDYFPNVLVANLKFSSNVTVCEFFDIVHPANFFYLLLSECVMPAFFSSYRVMTTFFNRVSVVVRWGTKKKVFGIAARRVVALVANIHSIWNRFFVCVLPSQSVSAVSHNFSSTDSNGKISVSTSRGDFSEPRPTFRFTSFFNFAPKTDLNRRHSLNGIPKPSPTSITK